MSDENDTPPSDNEGPPEASSSSPKSPANGPPLVLIAIIVLVLIAASIALYWYVNRDTRPDVWENATVPYSEEACEEEGACEIYSRSMGGHGSHDEGGLFEFSYNPAIDDEIAQWGDCLDSVFTCINEGMAAAEAGGEVDPASLINGCVAQSQCPGECKDRFASRAAGRSFERLEAIFFEMFVDDRGYCVPREADQ